MNLSTYNNKFYYVIFRIFCKYFMQDIARKLKNVTTLPVYFKQ